MAERARELLQVVLGKRVTQGPGNRSASRRDPRDRDTAPRIAIELRRVFEKHAIAARTPYMTRHPTATRIEEAADFDTAKMVLGQRSVAVALRHVNGDSVAAAAAMAKHR